MLQEFTDADSKLFFKASREDLYKFQVENEKIDHFIKTILRSYGGLFNEFVKIDEEQIAKRLDLTPEKVVDYILELEKYQIAIYLRRKGLPIVTFLTERTDAKDISISNEHYSDRKKEAEARLKSVLSYLGNTGLCRSRQLLYYFNEPLSKRCGKCDVCIERNKIELSEFEFDNILQQIKPLLLKKPYSMEEIIHQIKNPNEDKIIGVVQWLLDNDKIIYDQEQKLSWNC
jgi:ATP-dependent DNA helicase RecQ